MAQFGGCNQSTISNYGSGKHIQYGARAVPKFNPNKDHSKFWDKMGRNKNKLNLTKEQQDKLLTVFGKNKKIYLKTIKGV
jgi:hypothetical protein